MRRTIFLILICFFGYYGFALFGAYQLRQAVLGRDPGQIEARIDFETLRARLKPRLKAVVSEEAQKFGAAGQVMAKALQGTVADKAIDALVTPAWVARALRGREMLPAGGARPAAAEADDGDDPMPPRRLRWAFFESPTRFRLEAVHPRLVGSRIVVVLGLDGFGWKLVDVDMIRI